MRTACVLRQARRSCCGYAARRWCARDREPLSGRPARPPLASARVRGPGSVAREAGEIGVPTERSRRDSIFRVTTSRGGWGGARAVHGRMGTHHGLGSAVARPCECSRPIRPGRSPNPKPQAHSTRGPEQAARGPTHHDPARRKNYSPTTPLYSVADISPASPPAATRTLIIQPSP